MLRLLDDETPVVREALMNRLVLLNGDVSEWIGECGAVLDERHLEFLVAALAPGRRRRLEEEWLAPVGGAAALGDDWEHVECLLRNLSDFLHDGVTLRPALPDGLDLLAEEAEEIGVDSPESLRVFLFREGAYLLNNDHEMDPRNLDLAWVIGSGRSDALGLCLLYLLLARRLELDVAAVDHPGHFFCRIHEDGRAYLVDCCARGTLHPLDELLRRSDISRAEKRFLESTVGPGTVLLRVLHDLDLKLRKSGREEDAEVVGRLRMML